MGQIQQLVKKPGTALVLSGGATKAFYFHLGVLKTLREERLSAVVGTSAGALCGAFIASGADVDDLMYAMKHNKVYLNKLDAWVETINTSRLFRPKVKRIIKQTLLTSLASARLFAVLPRLFRRDFLGDFLDMLMKSQTEIDGFFETSALADMIKPILPSDDFSNTRFDLYITGTSLDSHKRGVFNSRYDFEDDDNLFMTDVPIHEAVRASTAIPGVFEPVKIKGNYYIDGEIKRTLSADIAVQVSDNVIVSHTYQPLIRTDMSVRDRGWVSILRQSLSMILYERMNVWRKIYQETHPEMRILWIAPDEEDVEFFNAPEFSFKSSVQDHLIHSGEIAAEQALERFAVNQ